MSQEELSTDRTQNNKVEIINKVEKGKKRNFKGKKSSRRRTTEKAREAPYLEVTCTSVSNETAVIAYNRNATQLLVIHQTKHIDRFGARFHRQNGRRTDGSLCKCGMVVRLKVMTLNKQ
jgi:hypothetical protein